MKTVLLTRHAESIANSGEASDDPGTIPLSEIGHAQAKNFSQSISLCPDVIILSRYLRTQQTAQPLRDLFPQAPVEIWDTIHEFTYLDQSRCVGMNAKQRRPLIDEYWLRNDPYHNDGGNAESFRDFVLRTDSSIRAVRNRKENRVHVFSHGQFILCAVMLLEAGRLPSSQDDLQKFMRAFHERSIHQTLKNTETKDISIFF